MLRPAFGRTSRAEDAPFGESPEMVAARFETSAVIWADKAQRLLGRNG